MPLRDILNMFHLIEKKNINTLRFRGRVNKPGPVSHNILLAGHLKFGLEPSGKKDEIFPSEYFYLTLEVKKTMLH